jgi:hypothetical protein
MVRMLHLYYCVCLASLVVSPAALADRKQPLIGQSEHVYTLASENTEIRGLAFDDISPEAPRLFVLDRSGWIFAYKLNQNPKEHLDKLTLVDRYALPREVALPRRMLRDTKSTYGRIPTGNTSILIAPTETPKHWRERIISQMTRTYTI